MSGCSSTQCDTTIATNNKRAAFRPRVDIVEVDGDLMLVADIPGADEAHTDVSLEKDILTIKGTIPAAEMDGYRMVHHEFRAGDFERSFTLTNKIDRGGIEATVKDGVLRVRLPKSGDVGPKKITVTSA